MLPQNSLNPAHLSIRDNVQHRPRQPYIGTRQSAQNPLQILAHRGQQNISGHSSPLTTRFNGDDYQRRFISNPNTTSSQIAHLVAGNQMEPFNWNRMQSPYPNAYNRNEQIQGSVYDVPLDQQFRQGTVMIPKQGPYLPENIYTSQNLEWFQGQNYNQPQMPQPRLQQQYMLPPLEGELLGFVSPEAINYQMSAAQPKFIQFLKQSLQSKNDSPPNLNPNCIKINENFMDLEVKKHSNRSNSSDEKISRRPLASGLEKQTSETAVFGTQINKIPTQNLVSTNQIQESLIQKFQSTFKIQNQEKQEVQRFFNPGQCQQESVFSNMNLKIEDNFQDITFKQNKQPVQQSESSSSICQSMNFQIFETYWDDVMAPSSDVTGIYSSSELRSMFSQEIRPKNDTQILANAQLFLDLQCQTSRESYELLNSSQLNISASEPSNLKIEIVPYALPFNPNSFVVMQIFPYFADHDKTSPGITKKYIDLSFKTLSLPNSLRNNFQTFWSEQLTQHFPEINPSELYGDNELKARAMATWKYAASLGVHEAPCLVYKNQKLKTMPKTEQEWQKLLNTINKDGQQI